MALGNIAEASKAFWDAIKYDPQACESYYELSIMIETTEEAEKLLQSIKKVKTTQMKPATKSFIEFATSNCFHKLENYDQAAKHLLAANKAKLKAYPSNANYFQRLIANSLSKIEPAEGIKINSHCGKKRIFIVGMPRSGSTLLETILSMNPAIKDLGESSSLNKAITNFKQQPERQLLKQNFDDFYSEADHASEHQITYTIDKHLYNFIYINWIARLMPEARIIHCQRNPLDNILSMYRSNLMAGNNYTSSLEDAAEILIAQEKAMRIHKKIHPDKIFTFNYDNFVNSPEENLSRLLKWLKLEFKNNYLFPEKSVRSINTASVMQARKPINNKSVGSWKNYKNLLQPALKILQESGIQVE